MKYLLPLFVLFSCTPIGNHVPPAADVSKSYKADWPKAEWTDILSKALDDHGKELLAANPGDLSDYCGSSDKKQAYIAIISSMARYESAFKPASTYTEKFADKNGNRVVSRGLLQISIESANGNYGCGFKSAQEIHDPARELPCVVKMFNKLVVQDKQIDGYNGSRYFGAARYWSVIRPGASHKQKEIKAKALSLCK